MTEHIAVTDNTVKNQYEITVEETVAGLESYLDDGDVRIFYHTEISDEFNGRGLASTLVKEAVDLAVADGKTIAPVCPYVKKWSTKHEEYAHAFTPVTSAHLALLG